MSTGVQSRFLHMFSVWSGVPQGGLLSHTATTFNTLRNCQIVFQNVLNHFTLPPSIYESMIFPHPSQHLLLSVFFFFFFSHTNGESVVSNGGFDLHFLLEHLFVSLLPTCMCSLEKRLFKSFAQFLKDYLSFYQ